MIREQAELPARSPSEVLGEGASRVAWTRTPNPVALSDVARQINFYRQLVSFEREVLEHMRSLAAGYPEELRGAVERSDIEPMEALIEQFEQRLSFWQQRDRELSSD
jgi:hypothetical protein